ncbi:MAG TPA: bestrophin family ion channel [Bacteroidia bacterium]
MKAYNPKDWTKLIFDFHRSQSFRMVLPAMAALAMYSAILCYLDIEMKVIHLKSTTVIHSLLGFVLSLLLVFRTNTAYDRWWEGRKLWGDLVNNSRNLMLKLNAFIPDEKKELKNEFRILITNYAFALKDHLRGGFIEGQLEDHSRLRIKELKTYNHVPNRIAQQLYAETESLRKQNIVSEETMLLLNEELRSFTNVAGACERIKKTPIPYSYSTFIKRVILLYIITLPIGLVEEYRWITIPMVLFVFYAFAGLELLAEEIEDPFGHEDNDLPIDEISNTIKKNLLEIVR